MQRSTAFRALAPLVLVALAAACDSPTAVGDSTFVAQRGPALSQSSTPQAPPVSTVVPIEGGGFRFVSTAVVDLPIGAVWAIVHNLEKDIQIALPMATDFTWLDGGSPGTAPSRYSFTVFGTTLLEEVFYMSHADHVVKYRLVDPALGIQSYAGTIDLDPIDATHTRLTFSREAVFDDPASAGPFGDLFHQEAVDIQAYFARRGS
jgi:hypothetical protein